MSDIIREVNEAENEFARAFPGNDLEPAETPRTEVDTRIDWLMERIAKRRRIIEDNDAVADARILQIEDWRQGENAKVQRQIDWFQSEIRRLLPIDAESFEREYGKKSRVLPFGTIGYKKKPDTIEVFDEERALAWAKERGLEIKTIPARETVAKPVLKKALETWSDPDGFEVIRGLDDFYVKVDVNGTQKGH